ncbi:FtsK/SpoIIIE domain-containing protein [Kineococcus sp. SYSU DK003]|uniref:FtsK/SpoIIIE domain-containing protein n=1 Tax=Kineococcus sp. SYSU DK003 TaxID=3383124 RepID=UPI003D7C397A
MVQVAAGVGCYAGAPLVQLDSWAMPGAVAAAVAAVGTGFRGERARRRGVLSDQLIEAVAPLLGFRRPSREHVKASRWRGAWVGTPGRVRLAYSRGSVNVEHPRWQQEVLSTVRRLLGQEYEVAGHDRRRGWLTLRPRLPDATDVVATLPVVQRATRTARELLGPTAVLEPILADELDAQDQLQLSAVVIAHQAGTRVATAAQRARIERTFSAMLPGRWRAQWQLEADTVRFEVRPTLAASVPHPAPTGRDDPDVLRNYDRVAIALAVDEDGREVMWRPAIDPHLMVVGATGTGKTVLLHGVLAEIASWGWQVFVNDAKSVEFLGFRQWPNVRAVATSIGEQVATIHLVHRLMEERYAAIIDGRAHESDFEPVVLVLDEFRDFYGNLIDWYARVRVTGKGGDPTKAPVIEKVKSIARKGRTARVHLVLGTQRPDADFLSGEALATDTPLPTPQGWTTMGEVGVGDFVLSEHGRPVRVVATTEVAVGRPCYRVTFSDGSSIVADEQHLWAVRRMNPQSLKSQQAGAWPAEGNADDWWAWPAAEGRAGRSRTLIWDKDRSSLIEGLPGGLAGSRAAGPGSALPDDPGAEALVVCTGDLARTVHGPYGGAYWSIAAAEPVQLPEADLLVDPWLLGYWLGSGHQGCAAIAAADGEAIARIERLGHRANGDPCSHDGPDDGQAVAAGWLGQGRDRLDTSLRALGVLYDQHVPVRYLRASRAQREQLLAGLLDANGTCAGGGDHAGGRARPAQVSFTHTERRLIDGFAELTASLGFIPTVHQVPQQGLDEHPGSVADGQAARSKWVVRFTLDRQVFGLSGKQRMLVPALHGGQHWTTQSRCVISVEPVPSVPVRCITVDSPTHLYLAGRAFIPTHNCRDNFRARVSLGRLSPQGSMMMWDSPSAAVSVPRGIRGRGITLDSDDRPCEIQTFWTPDPRKVRPDQHADLDTLLRLWPTHRAHEPLVILPPQPSDAVEGDEPRYRQWADAFCQSRANAGPASTEHLRHVARIVPLALHPQAAPRSTMSPAFASRVAEQGSGESGDGLQGEAPRDGYGEDLGENRGVGDGSVGSGGGDDGHGDAGRGACLDADPVQALSGAYGEAVTVEPDPAGPRFVTLQPRTTGPAAGKRRTPVPTRDFATDASPGQSGQQMHSGMGEVTAQDLDDAVLSGTTASIQQAGRADVDARLDAGLDGSSDDNRDVDFEDGFEDGSDGSADIHSCNGYGSVEDLLIDDLEAGMLVLLDEDGDHWAVLEDDPQIDVDDETARCLNWRDDNDESGSLSVDADALVTARRLLEGAQEPLEHLEAASVPPRGWAAPSAVSDRHGPCDPQQAVIGGSGKPGRLRIVR